MGHIHPPACTVHSSHFYFVYRKRNSAPHKAWGISGTGEHVGDWCWPCWWQKGEGGTGVQRTRCEYICIGSAGSNSHPAHLYSLIITLQEKESSPSPKYLIKKTCAMWKLSDRDLSSKKIIIVKYCHSQLGILLLFPPASIARLESVRQLTGNQC